MIKFDRRQALTSLAQGVGASVVSGAANAVCRASPTDVPEGSIVRQFCWVLAKQEARMGPHHPIDFWTGPWSSVRYENHLPAQVAQGLIAYEDFSCPVGTEREALEAFRETAKFYDRDWLDPNSLDRVAITPAAASKDFQSLFTTFAGENSMRPRTALIAIDSPFGELRRPGVGAAFAACYDSIVGISHIGERGFVQQKRFSEAGSESDFIQGFLRDTSVCDTVIITSSGLLELDAGLSASASTEDLVGELVRRLSYAMMQPEMLARIVGPSGTKSERRYFALGSATLNVAFDPLLHLQMMLERQSAFVSASFAPLATDQLPLFIATSCEEQDEMRTGMLDILAHVAANSDYCRNASCAGILNASNLLGEVDAPCYQADVRRPGRLDLVTLWPFKPEV